MRGTFKRKRKWPCMSHSVPSYTFFSLVLVDLMLLLLFLLFFTEQDLSTSRKNANVWKCSAQRHHVQKKTHTHTLIKTVCKSDLNIYFHVKIATCLFYFVPKSPTTYFSTSFALHMFVSFPFETWSNSAKSSTTKTEIWCVGVIDRREKDLKCFRYFERKWEM